MGGRRLDIRRCHRNRAAREFDRIDPGQRRSVAVQFLSDDPAARLVDGREAAPAELSKQRRLSAAGAAGDDDKPFDDVLLTG
jgi:hypothetical protein